MTKDKRLFRDNVDNVVGFMLKTFPERRELLSKIKVLNIGSKSARNIDSSADVMEQIARNIFSIKSIDKGGFMENMMELFEEPTSFSRSFLLYFYRNSSLDAAETKDVLDILSSLLLEKTRLKEDFEDFIYHFRTETENKDISGGSDGSEEYSSDVSEEAPSAAPVVPEAGDESSSDTNITLVSLNDSDEIRRIDTSLSALFGKSKTLSREELMVCTKTLDVMEVIVENSYVGDSDVVPVLLYISGSGQAIFKRVLSVLRKIFKRIGYGNREELHRMFCHCLEWNPDVVRMTMLMVEVCGDDFDWNGFFEAVEKNKEVDLGVVDRTYISRPEFYRFLCRAEDVQRFFKMARNMIRNETSIDSLVGLNEALSVHSDEKCSLRVRSAIFDRIKSLNKDGNDVAEEKKTKQEKEDQSDAA